MASALAFRCNSLGHATLIKKLRARIIVTLFFGTCFTTKLEIGFCDALDGAGLPTLDVTTEWNRDRDILFAGGAQGLEDEIHRLAQECRDAGSDIEAQAIVRGYIKQKRCVREMGRLTGFVLFCLFAVVLDC